ncbi:MAG: DEAD/DEAH box helicase [Bacteroidota bacterium]
MTFKELQLEPSLQEGIEAIGFEKPTPIQEQSIPLAMKGKDLMGIAQTGTGKTAAFILPLIHRLMTEPNNGKLRSLVLVPTRELAVQIDQTVEGLAYFTGVSSMAIYGGGGGTDFAQEKTALTSGTDIIIATPGRMLSHINLGYVDFGEVITLVLDEADRMLDMGFQRDLLQILRAVNPDRQTLFYSATMPDKIMSFANNILKEPEIINIALSKPADGVIQGAYVVHNHQKNGVLKSLLVGKDIKSAIVFSSTKRTVTKLYQDLKRAGVNCGAISSDFDQEQREKILLEFRNREVAILVATDVVARGIDIDNIELVVNYDVPSDAEDYVHRIGRTARAETTGMGLTLIGEDEQDKFGRIEKLIGSEVKKLAVPEELGETPEYNPNLRRSRPSRGNFKGKRKPFKGKGKGKGKHFKGKGNHSNKKSGDSKGNGNRAHRDSKKSRPSSNKGNQSG